MDTGVVAIFALCDWLHSTRDVQLKGDCLAVVVHNAECLVWKLNPLL
jgi:hypothetical protein